MKKVKLFLLKDGCLHRNKHFPLTEKRLLELGGCYGCLFKRDFIFFYVIEVIRLYQFQDDSNHLQFSNFLLQII